MPKFAPRHKRKPGRDRHFLMLYFVRAERRARTSMVSNSRAQSHCFGASSGQDELTPRLRSFVVGF
jgi:hypothetical protein